MHPWKTSFQFWFQIWLQTRGVSTLAATKKYDGPWYFENSALLNWQHKEF